MSKRRAFGEIELNTLRSAARAGYVSYRYGSAAPVTLPRIFTGDQRRSTVSRVKSLLRGWSLSPFENEGPTRAGLRSSLCIDGHPWPVADFEAAELIAEALHKMGARRPTWAEGQREYATGADYCQYCRGPLDEEDIARHRRFCSTDCAGRFLRTRDDDAGVKADQTRFHAYYLTRTERFPERPCAWCGTAFRPTVADSQACSIGCREKLHTASLPQRTCAHCRDVFQPRKHHAKFCSRACTTAAQSGATAAKRAEERGERSCPECRTVFRPKRADKIFCSPKCGSRASARASNQRRKAEEKAASAFICEECPPMLEAA